MQHTIITRRSRVCRRLAAGAVGVCAGLSGLALAASPAGAQNFTNARVADVGLSEIGTRRPTGWNQPGECIKSVQRWVAAAGGSFGGGGVTSSYQRSGATGLANINQAVKGDVLQRTNGNDQDWSKVHTVVVVQNYGNGRFWIVQSNAPGYVNGVYRRDGAGLVTEDRNWAPTAAPGWYWTAWRFGTAGGSPAPQPSSVRYRTTAEVNLRTGPGTGYRIIRRVPANTPIDVVCQARGTNVGGNVIWDKLAGGEWVTDTYTSTPSWNNLAPPYRWC